jgi:hypothetical protein
LIFKNWIEKEHRPNAFIARFKVLSKKNTRIKLKNKNKILVETKKKRGIILKKKLKILYDYFNYCVDLIQKIIFKSYTWFSPTSQHRKVYIDNFLIEKWHVKWVL